MDLKQKLIAAARNTKKRATWVDSLKPETQKFFFESLNQYLDGELPQIPNATVFLHAIKQVASEIQEHVQWPSRRHFSEWLKNYKEKRTQSQQAPTRKVSRRPKPTSKRRSS